MKLRQLLILIFYVNCLGAVAMSDEVTPSDIELNADKVNVDINTNRTELYDSVRVKYLDQKLSADKAVIEMDQRKAYAEGNVALSNKGQVYFCDHLNYDFGRKRGEMWPIITTKQFWVIEGERIDQENKDLVVMQNARFYVCPHFYFKSKKVSIKENKILTARHVTAYMGKVPIFYWPYLKRNLNKDERLLSIRAGKNSRFGVYVLTGVRAINNEFHESDISVDYYQDKGIGLGVSGEFTHEAGGGEYNAYYIRDDQFEPIRSTEEEGELTRHWINLNHHVGQGLWTSDLELNLLSDIDFADDFMFDDFDAEIQSVNFYELQYLSNHISTSFEIRPRLNDFYNVIERLPALNFSVTPVSITESAPFYYWSTTRGEFIRKRLANVDEIDKDLFRFYTGHTVSYSKYLFGFLNFVPEIRLEQLYYSESRDTDPVTLIVDDEAGGIHRSHVVFSAQFSTNIFKIFEAPKFGFDRFRHNIFPTLGFSFSPEPNVENDEINQFDELDDRRESRLIRLGVVSRWLGKKGSDVYTILNTTYGIEYDLLDEGEWGNFVWRTEIRPHDRLFTNAVVSFDVEESELNYFQLNTSWQMNDHVAAGLTFLDLNEDGTFISPEINIKLGDTLFLRAYMHYNDEESLVERYEVSLVKEFHCYEVALRIDERDFRDEQGIYITFSPKLMRSAGLRFGKR